MEIDSEKRARLVALRDIMKSYGYDDGVEALESIFPELRESEDERTRKHIVTFIMEADRRGEAPEECAKWLAYLEKQKEQKPNYCHYGGDPNVERCKLCSAACIGRLTEDQKPVEWSDAEKEQVEICKGCTNDKGCVTCINGSEWEYKPVEWSEVELEFRGEKVTVKRPFYRDDKGRGYSTTEQDEDVAWNALRAWCEKKGVSLYDLYPREKWDEVDETKLRDVIRIVEDSGYIKSIQEHYKEFLSSLPERFNLRPVKQEWSEDEQTVIDCVVDVLEKDGLSSLAASVRHLRPQPKQEWSKVDGRAGCNAQSNRRHHLGRSQRLHTS